MWTNKSLDKKDKNFRWWLHITDNWGLSFEICWKSFNFHWELISYNEDYGWGFSFAIPPIAFYFHIDTPFRLKEDKELRFSFHNGSLWWNLWVNDWGEHRLNDWRRGNFSFDDFFLGKKVCTKKILEERDVLIPMPEKSYPAKAKLIEYTWKRKRWFSNSINRVDIEVEGGIPHEGKGTASYNCGTDAIFGMTTGECSSIPRGVGQLVGSALDQRVQYGGWGDYKWEK